MLRFGSRDVIDADPLHPARSQNNGIVQRIVAVFALLSGDPDIGLEVIDCLYRGRIAAGDDDKSDADIETGAR